MRYNFIDIKRQFVLCLLQVKEHFIHTIKLSSHVICLYAVYLQNITYMLVFFSFPKMVISKVTPFPEDGLGEILLPCSDTQLWGHNIQWAFMVRVGLNHFKLWPTYPSYFQNVLNTGSILKTLWGNKCLPVIQGCQY